jgi:hypothetical protein
MHFPNVRFILHARNCFLVLPAAGKTTITGGVREVFLETDNGAVILRNENDTLRKVLEDVSLLKRNCNDPDSATAAAESIKTVDLWILRS